MSDTRIYQDVAGTVPAAQDGDPVGRVEPLGLSAEVAAIQNLIARESAVDIYSARAIPPELLGPATQEDRGRAILREHQALLEAYGRRWGIWP